MSDLKKTLSELKPGDTLSIHGYVSSKGDVFDYTVRLLEDDGYRRLIQESLDKRDLLTPPEDMNPETEMVDWQVALREQLESWKKSLEGGHHRETRPLTKEGAIWVDETQPDVIILKNLYCVECKPRQETVPVKSAAKTRFKNHIRAQCPIGNYLGQLNLKEGKFECVIYRRGDATEPDTISRSG